MKPFIKENNKQNSKQCEENKVSKIKKLEQNAEVKCHLNHSKEKNTPLYQYDLEAFSIFK